MYEDIALKGWSETEVKLEKINATIYRITYSGTGNKNEMTEIKKLYKP